MVDYCRSLFKKSSINVNSKVEVPVLLIMGEKDYVLKISGREEYIRSGEIKELVPDLELAFIPEGTHFVQEQFPEKINELLIDFLKKHL